MPEFFYNLSFLHFQQLFLSCLEAVQSEHLLKEIDQHKLFSNIRDICDANLKLWSLYLYPMVSDLFGHCRLHNLNDRWYLILLVPP